MKTTNILLGILCVLVAVLCFITGYVHCNCRKHGWDHNDHTQWTGSIENNQSDEVQQSGTGSNSAGENGTRRNPSSAAQPDGNRYSGGGAANYNGATSSTTKGVGNADAETGTSKLKPTSEQPLKPKKKGGIPGYSTQPAGTGTSSGRQIN